MQNLEFYLPMMQKIILSLVFTTFLFLGNSLWAQERRATTYLAFGGYLATDGEDSIQGSQISLGLTLPFEQSWDYFARVSSEQATGTHKNTDGSTSNLSADTVSFQGGLQWNFIRQAEQKFIPYISGGLSLQTYNYDFQTRESEIGKTSGIGAGYFTSLGLKMNLSRNFRMIPAYHFSQNYIQTEEGSQKAITSSGTSIALIASF